jgi:aspartyl-tRNA(Asn)/glutamyl-tRNA(Gln) amidotransferase subunit A
VFTGKTNLDEFAMGSSTENSAFGPTKNPWNPEHVPGGSSGGSAAVVSVGSALASLGSDTGGSIRQPASFCGVVGFKPTYGTVSRYGLVAFASSLDQIGPITNSVEDAKIIFNSIKGHDPLDATSIEDTSIEISDDKTAKVGVIKELMEDGISDESKIEVEKTIKLLEDQGNKVVEVSLPLTKVALSIYYLIAPAECSANLSRFDGVRYGLREVGETSYQMMENTRAEGFGEEVKKRILLGTYALSAGYYDAYYGQALKARSLITKDFENIFKDVDYLISPTTPTPAFKFGEKTENPLEMYMSDLCTIPANLAGLPAISIPTGLSSQNLPLSIQLMSPARTDSSLLKFSEKIEKLISFDQRTPLLKEMK